MKREVAERWINELRSGKHKQTKYRLHSQDGMCCLGVLCVVAKEMGLSLPTDDSHFYDDTDDRKTMYLYGIEREEGVLPKEVVLFAGMRTKNGEYSNDAPRLYELNDREGKSFAEIADIIEQNIDNL